MKVVELNATWKGDSMVDTLQLEYLIKKSGHTNGDCADHLGITFNSFINKKTNKTEFKFSEIVKLAEYIGITINDPVFFATKVELNDT